MSWGVGGGRGENCLVCDCGLTGGPGEGAAWELMSALLVADGVAMWSQLSPEAPATLVVSVERPRCDGVTSPRRYVTEVSIWRKTNWRWVSGGLRRAWRVRVGRGRDQVPTEGRGARFLLGHWGCGMGKGIGRVWVPASTAA